MCAARTNSPGNLAACPVLAGIPPEHFSRDCPKARIVAVPHRGTIYRQGEPARTIFCVLDGQVTIARTASDGSILVFGKQNGNIACFRLKPVKK